MDRQITAQDIKEAIVELVKSQKETDNQFNRLSIELEKAYKEMKEDTRKMKEDTRKMKEDTKRMKEDTKKMKEDTKSMKEDTVELKNGLKEAKNLFTGQWGKLMEALVDGEAIKLFNERNIKVVRTSTRVKGNYEGQNYEFDIIAHNGDEVIVIEVKTTMKVGDVKKHLERLKNVKTWLPYYKNDTVYGAMAFLKAEEKSDQYAQSKGLWVIRATGNSASIINKDNFEARSY